MLGVLQTLLRRVHSLPEEVRKLLAGVLIVGAALGFFGMWGPFMSSRLVALGPPPTGSNPQGAATPSAVAGRPQPAGVHPLSPAEGIAETFYGIRQIGPIGPTSKIKHIFAAIGNAVAGSIEFLYQKLSRYVPPNL